MAINSKTYNNKKVALMIKKQAIQSNKLTRAIYKIKLQPYRIMMLGILNANKDGEAYISAEDFSRYYGVSLAKAKDTLTAEKTTILSHNVVLNHANGDFSAFVWVQQMEYTHKTNVYKLKFSDAITQEITNLKKNITAYNLENVGKLNNVLFIKLYKELLSWRGTGKLEVTIDYLLTTYMLPDSYKKWTNIKARFLDKAVSDINTKTNLRVRYEPIKQGRKYVSIKFFFIDLDAEALEREKSASKPAKQAKRLNGYGVDLNDRTWADNLVLKP